MPLSRLNDGFEIELEGIAFGMVVVGSMSS